MKALLTAQDCATMLGVGYKAFCDRICKAPGFPKPIDAAHVQRLWKSAEVSAWAGTTPETRQSAEEPHGASV